MFVCRRALQRTGKVAAWQLRGVRRVSGVVTPHPRLRIVMDIDECMIHTFDMEDERRQIEERQDVVQEISDLDTREIKCEDGMKVRLHVRPGLDDYLKELSEFADVYAFTAAMSVYARPVIHSLDPNNDIFRDVWYRESCSIVRFGRQTLYAKDLEMLKKEYEPNRTILVDNNLYSFVPQPSNGILVPAFYDNPQDSVLPQVLDIVKQLDKESDVKPVLDELFNLRSQIQTAIDKM